MSRLQLIVIGFDPRGRPRRGREGTPNQAGLTNCDGSRCSGRERFGLPGKRPRGSTVFTGSVDWETGPGGHRTLQVKGLYSEVGRP